MHRIARAAVILASLSTVIPSIAQSETAKITVRVFNRSRVAASVLAEGEKQTQEILQRAGIEVKWLNCGHGAADCAKQPNPTNLILTILKKGSALGSQETLGLAAQDATGSGTYCYVFENKLNEISGQKQIPIARLLGYAMSHEIGHLLKGSHSHSPTGVMSGLWSQNELDQLARRALWFTQQDATGMQSRLSRFNGMQQTFAKLRSGQ